MIYLKKLSQIILIFFLAVLLSCCENEPESQTSCFIRFTNDRRQYSYDCGTEEELKNSDFSNFIFPEKDESGRYIFWSSLKDNIIVDECSDCDQYKSIMESSSGRKPPSRMYHELVFHKETESIILLGGQTVPAFGTDLQDVWAYWIDDNFWESIGINKSTKNLTSGVMSPAYDEESNRIIAFNDDGETWSFHLEELEWEEMKPVNAPSPRFGHMMTYDSNSDRIILFGGFEGTWLGSIYDDTWVYDFNSNTWTEMNPEIHPSPRMYAEMIFNNHSNKMIFWGGRTWDVIRDNSIWEYDFIANSWEEIVVENGPEMPFPYFGMLYDDQNNEMFLFGGPSDTGKLVHWKYSFDENLWNLLEIENGPPYMLKHAIVLHPLLRKAVLFSGVIDEDPFTLSESTWILDLETLEWEEL